MPGRDGTGPAGMGLLSGRGMGYGAGFTMPEYSNSRSGKGRQRGIRRMYCATGIPRRTRNRFNPQECSPLEDAARAADQKEVLQNRAAFLERRLSQVRERLKGFDETVQQPL